MILDSLMGIFNSSSKNEQKVSDDVLLRQGDLYHSYQNGYFQKVAPHLSLMEKTTGPVIEGFREGQQSKQSKQSLDNLEEQYNATLGKYVELTRQITDIDVKHLKHAPTKAKLADLRKKLSNTSDSLIGMANEIHKAIGQGPDRDIDASRKLRVKEDTEKLFKIITELKDHRTKLHELEPPHNTFHSAHADNKLRVNYAYYHYIMWLFIVIVIVGVFTGVLFNFIPTLQWPWKGVYIIGILIILWILGSAINSKFWTNV